MKPSPPLKEGLATALTNPATLHTTAAIGTAGIASAERLSSSTPNDGVKMDDTVVGGLRLEHEANAVVAFKKEKRSPVRDMSLKAVEPSAGVTTRDKVMVILIAS